MTDRGYNEIEIIASLKDESRRAAAFSVIVNRYSQQIYWHIRRMVLSHEDTNDLVQNTFVKAWMNIDKFRGDSRISTWLYRIAINETLTFLGKNTNSTVSINSPEGSVAELLESDTYFNGDKADALLHEAISKLPDKQRLTFNMKYFEDIKYEEMSEILGTSVGALKASYHIAVKKIEEYLSDKD
ncbi:MAG: sigma-70 family RNA polymerase sigma factor [Bacteroidaceae bacterium]|nr:sigma-70 family RNA polymerase sigma factor [Bacteroidaceae bacterium]